MNTKNMENGLNIMDFKDNNIFKLISFVIKGDKSFSTTDENLENFLNKTNGNLEYLDAYDKNKKYTLDVIIKDTDILSLFMKDIYRTEVNKNLLSNSNLKKSYKKLMENKTLGEHLGEYLYNGVAILTGSSVYESYKKEIKKDYVPISDDIDFFVFDQKQEFPLLFKFHSKPLDNLTSLDESNTFFESIGEILENNANYVKVNPTPQSLVSPAFKKVEELLNEPSDYDELISDHVKKFSGMDKQVKYKYKLFEDNVFSFLSKMLENDNLPEKYKKNIIQIQKLSDIVETLYDKYGVKFYLNFYIKLNIITLSSDTRQKYRIKDIKEYLMNFDLINSMFYALPGYIDGSIQMDFGIKNYFGTIIEDEGLDYPRDVIVKNFVDEYKDFLDNPFDVLINPFMFNNQRRARVYKDQYLNSFALKDYIGLKIKKLPSRISKYKTRLEFNNFNDIKIIGMSVLCKEISEEFSDNFHNFYYLLDKSFYSVSLIIKYFHQDIQREIKYCLINKKKISKEISDNYNNTDQNVWFSSAGRTPENVESETDIKIKKINRLLKLSEIVVSEIQRFKKSTSNLITYNGNYMDNIEKLEEIVFMEEK